MFLNSLNPNSVIYDHRPSISPKPSPPKKPAPQAQAQQSLNELLHARNSLKVSSVSSLSNLLALDDQRLSSNQPTSPQDMSKSNTLPHKSAILIGGLNTSNQSANRFPIYNVNFNEPDKKKTTSSVSLTSSLGPTDELAGSDDDIIDLK